MEQLPATLLAGCLVDMATVMDGATAVGVRVAGVHEVGVRSVVVAGAVLVDLIDTDMCQCWFLSVVVFCTATGVTSQI